MHQNTNTPMRVLPFKIPKPDNEMVRHQVDQVAHFYDKLHQHPEVQLTLIIKGEGSLVVGDYIGRFAPGEIYLLGSNTPHVFRNTDFYYQEKESRFAHSQSLFFDLEIIDSHFSGIHEFEKLTRVLSGLDGCYRIRDEQNFIRKRILKLRDARDLQKILLSLEVLDRIINETNLERLNKAGSVKNYSAREGKRMEKVMRFILEQSHRHISLSEVADLANMNKEAFCRFFKERTRKTFTGFLNEERITRACHLLSNKDMTISQIASEAGFPNLSYFNRVFKNLKKVTPKTYRASIFTEIKTA